MAAKLEPAPAVVLPFPALMHPPASMGEQDPSGPKAKAGAETTGKAPPVIQAGTGLPTWEASQEVKEEPPEEPVQRWQVTVHKHLQDVALDMEGPGALREPLGSQEKGRWSETPGTQEELTCVPKEEPPSHQEPGVCPAADSPDTEETWDSSADETSLSCFPKRGRPRGAAGGWTLSTAEEQPPEEGPGNLQLLRPSLGRSGERGLPTPVLGQVHEKQSWCPQQRENVAVSKPDPHLSGVVENTRATLQTMDGPAPSSSSSQTRGHNWEYGEVRDLIAIWGDKKIQHQLQKRHRNRDIFTCIAQQMQARGHNRDWMQCRAKTKVMKSKFSKAHDASQHSGARRPTMPFYDELSRILAKDRAVEIPHAYGTTAGQEDLEPGTPPDEEELVTRPVIARETDGQEGVLRGSSGRTQLLVPAPKETSTLLLVPTSSQSMGAEVQLKLEICSQDIFLPLSKTTERTTQEGEASSDDTDIKMQDLDSPEVPSTSQEPTPNLTSTQQTVAKHTAPSTVFLTQGPRPEQPTTSLPHPCPDDSGPEEGHPSALEGTTSHSSTQPGGPGVQDAGSVHGRPAQEEVDGTSRPAGLTSAERMRDVRRRRQGCKLEMLQSLVSLCDRRARTADSWRQELRAQHEERKGEMDRLVQAQERAAAAQERAAAAQERGLQIAKHSLDEANRATAELIELLRQERELSHMILNRLAATYAPPEGCQPSILEGADSPPIQEWLGCQVPSPSQHTDLQLRDSSLGQQPGPMGTMAPFMAPPSSPDSGRSARRRRPPKRFQPSPEEPQEHFKAGGQASPPDGPATGTRKGRLGRGDLG
ncbi:zinc finger and SCAN domain-containing protein 29-like [Alligator sinensis]|uniref:Zinc finger and SCAN domain-containing protein 29-like n=1 Tax=Alligator sinensis TaxID=38654 RepID=A0A1U7SEX3_ALLSI|nr:zinc finger and SCAN domain-containing protein 29-like [Alligator sinensis]XP_025048506.1 zinc finger and SCAN domain-containing protein 29-like [Alligator sinensis]XP_025048507.1 zinc finger and SCAN domain-containing protein 29-like [Alligator sinensis]XP_025048508.1 zinc finger and SCAN domain-containing protein 29-like [Alligator sinensis]